MTSTRINWNHLAATLRHLATSIEEGKVTAINLHAEAGKPARLVLEGSDLEAADWEDTKPAASWLTVDAVGADGELVDDVSTEGIVSGELEVGDPRKEPKE